jgi:protein O-GlcNAc transferase
VEAVDYLIGDSVSTPANGAQLFTEEVVRLEPCRFCYSPPPYAPQVAAAPALRNGYVTFGSFNRLSKMVPAVFESWSRVLAAVPSSRLLLKNAAFTDERTRTRVADAFGRQGIGAERIELRAHSSHPQMLAEYGEIDIALDPFPFNGGLTTCEALWMGVPVLALLGDSMISRQGASILHAAGLQDWVAAEGEDFVRRAVDFSCDLGMLGRLRGEMRSRLAATPLLDAARFATAFGNLLDAMAQRTTIR